METLKAGIVINNMLTSNTDLNKIVKNRIFPIVSESDTTFPFIVYRRASLTTRPIKFGNVGEDVNMEILIISEGYKEGVELAQKVRDILDYKDSNGFEIKLIDASEDYSEAYVQKLIFKLNK